MSIEFTGERVVPDQVDRDLWNEHIARYSFARRLARRRRVLDIGCGAGYGTAELAGVAWTATGLDIAPAAVSYARAHYGRDNTSWTAGSAAALPFRDGSFDLVVAFEVIEHLAEWRLLLTEVKRVLAPGGQFIVSTPNKLYYSESRELTGPNPYHHHEFEFSEFCDALTTEFPHVSMFLQDHSEGILIQSVGPKGATDVIFERNDATPGSSNFYIAVCAMTQQTGAPTFIYVPSAANMLKERWLHIQKLNSDLAELGGKFRRQSADLETSNRWAAELDQEVNTARGIIAQLQGELVAMAKGYQARVAELEQEITAVQGELDERTRWALRLDRQREQLEAQLAMYQASRWVRFGRKLGLGPRPDDGEPAGQA